LITVNNWVVVMGIAHPFMSLHYKFHVPHQQLLHPLLLHNYLSMPSYHNLLFPHRHNFS
jgi:hypothetical protein